MATIQQIAAYLSRMGHGINTKFQDACQVTHDFCDDTTWPNTSDSRYTIEVGTDKLVEIPSVQFLFSADVDWHSPLRFQWYDGDNGGEVISSLTKTFSNTNDFLEACGLPYVVPAGSAGNTNAVYFFNYFFEKPNILRDVSTENKARKLIVDIQSDTQYETASSGTPEFLRVSFRQYREIDEI